MIFELQEVDLKQSRFYQEVFAEGREEGWEDGRKEGLSVGREAEAHTLVLRQLRRRFGFMDADTEARIGALSLAHLETLAEDLLGFQVAADLQRWLDALPDRSAGFDA
jgi:predicted transposase YdaD